MKALNKTSDLKTFLGIGALTKPFLSNDELNKQTSLVKERLLKEGKNADIEDCLLDFVRSNLQTTTNKRTIAAHQFSRTAKEIFESGEATGCTDYALVFATLCRQLNIPTTILETAQKEWVNKFINKMGDCNMHYGHTFCECFLNDKWILVDPTFGKTDWHYDSSQPIKLIDYKIASSVSYLPYFRGLDMGKLTIKLHNEMMDSAVKLLYGSTYDNKKVVEKFHQIKSPNELKSFMDNILTYGFMDHDNIEHLQTMHDLEKHRVLSVEEILYYKLETCAEAAKLAKYWFSTNGYECKLFFERIKRHEHETGEYFNHSTHFYILFNDPKLGWCRFEQSSTDDAGVTVFGDYDRAIKHVIDDVELTRQNQIDFNKDRDVDFDTYGIYQFEDIYDDDSYITINQKADEFESVLNQKTKSASF